jgi:hypothetical protein
MAAPPQKTFLRQPSWVAAILITAIVVWLHFFFLIHAGGLWRDEINLVNLAGRHSLAEMQKDSFPVLMPLLVSDWSGIGLGQSDLGLRFLGTLVGLGTVAALWASAWTARRPPLISLALFALNCMVIIYGDSLRGYGLGCLFIVLTTGAAWAFLKKPAWTRTAVFAAMAILSVHALYQNAVLFAAICFGAWTVCWRRKDFPAAVKILWVSLAAAISLLPYWKNISGLPAAAVSERTGFSPALVFDNFAAVLALPKPAYLYVWGFLALIIVGLGGQSWCAHFSKPRAFAGEAPTEGLPLFAGATLLAALAGFAGFLWFAAVPTQAWYFLPPIALAAACFDLGLLLPSLHRYCRAAIYVLMAATVLIAVPFAHQHLNVRFTNVDLLARQLAVEASPQDFIVVSPWYCGLSFERYFKGATPWQTLPPLADHSTHRYDLFQEKMKMPHPLQPILDQIAATLQGGHRVWVVGWMGIPEPGVPPPDDLPPPPLKSSGWSDIPYFMVWTEQTAWFLENHSLSFTCLESETNNNVIYHEHLNRFMASGWKDSSQPVSTLNSETNKP